MSIEISANYARALACPGLLWQPARMNALEQIDLLARGGSLALIAFWSWLLWRDQRQALAARVAVAMNAAIIAYLLGNKIWALWPYQPFAFAIDWSSVLAAPLFWLFSHVWFNDVQRISRRVSLLIIAFALLALSQSYFMATTGAVDPVIWMTVRIGMISFAAAGVWIAWRGRDDDLVEARRRVRRNLVWTTGLLVIWISIMEIPFYRGPSQNTIRVITQLAILWAAAITSAAMYRMKYDDIFAPATPGPSNPQRVAIDPALAERLQNYMETERAWRDETLSIAKLASQLGEQEYRLRRVINGQLGHRNFAAFVNGYRLAEVKAALADDSQKEVPIITIALDAGFGSLGPFNRAFREAEKMTPSEYRNADS